MTDQQIEAIWQRLPRIEIHNQAAREGVKTEYALRIAFARAILEAAAPVAQAPAPDGPSAEDYSDMIRQIAFEYSAGGYNSEGLLSIESAEGKLRWIIDDVRSATQIAASMSALKSQPAAVGDSGKADTARIDYLEAWRQKSLAAGYAHDTYQITVDLPVREQLDRAMENTPPYERRKHDREGV